MKIKLMPMVIGGVVGGIIAGIPILNCLNCCCLMYIASGAIAAYLILKEEKLKIEDLAINGAGAGAIAGFIGGTLSFIFSMFINVASLMATYGGEDMVGNMAMNTGMGLLSIPIAIIFGAIAGAIGAVIYGKLKE